MGSLFEVVVAVGPGARHAGLGGEVEHVPQGATVALWAAQVAGAPARVVGDRNKSGCGGEVSWASIANADLKTCPAGHGTR